MRMMTLLGLFTLLVATVQANEADGRKIAEEATAVLKTHCYRCHGQDGNIEGGMAYILDRDRIVAARKVVPGNVAQSRLFQRVLKGKMPPAEVKTRPSEDEIAILKKWIEMGAPSAKPQTARQFITEGEVYQHILADLEKMERRSRRFQRYFTLTHLHNAGLGDDELQTYRHAIAKLVNSLSWHPRISVPEAIDPAKTILRIDLRWFMWDANVWNRILAEYPYGILSDASAARACYVATASKMPSVRGDWFVATASRPPLYQDVLQLPSSASELERQLRVDAALNIQQERVARAGFNGSGISKNNRLLERHDAVHGALWKSYDFDAVPQNLIDRQNLLPDRRNLFAYPLGPGFQENTFLHAGGEMIFNLPNGLHAFMLVNANGTRIDKGPLAIVSDPKRPDRAVETGISCMSCHVAGIHFKSDQIREHVEKNPQAFSRTDAELIRALYVPEAKMKALMEEDAERYRKAVEKTGAGIRNAEQVGVCTLRYEADLDLPTAAAELGLTADELMAKLASSSTLTRSLGGLKVPGGTVHRQIFIQAFGDMVKDLRLGTLFLPTQVQSLPDNTGEVDPLEGASSQANAMVFSPDARLALFASADKSVRVWELERNIELRRLIGHTASVWAVAFSPDGKRALSGSADNSVRLWDVETGRELLKMDGHVGLVAAVAFSPDGRRALSGSYDHSVWLWDLETGRKIRSFRGPMKYVNSVAFLPDGKRAVISGGNFLLLWDTETGEELRRLADQPSSITMIAVAKDGRRILTSGDDHSVRLWDADTGQELRRFEGHTSYVKCVAFLPDGQRALSGGADNTVRLWDLESGKELGRWSKPADAVISVHLTPDGRYVLAGSRNSAIGW
jgi:mono/diheme cytochrome c family protein/sugar lactone lactonase YvrE